jgi:nitrogen-specific signal transduction histidine kinase
MTTDQLSRMEASSADLSRLFHRLNNQLGIILANAELLESRVTDEAQRARAEQVVKSVMDAIATVQTLRRSMNAAVDE